MKKIITSSILACFIAMPAIASDGGLYMEDYSSTSRTSARVNTVYYVDARQAAPQVRTRPCGKASAPISVKTHTEVVDHYQVYQPVTTYHPVGTYAERRVIEAPRPCNKCRY